MASVVAPASERSRRLSLRRVIGPLHSWVGAVAALLIVAVSLTGSALVFVDDMFRAQYGAMLDAPVAQSLDLDRILSGAQAEAGDKFRMFGVLMPHSRIDVAVAMPFGMPADGRGFEDLTMLPVDPGNGAAKGSFKLNDAFGHQVINFHHQLMLGDSGATLMTVVGLLLGLFAASGVYLWWPRGGGLWRKASRLDISGPPLRAMFRLHSFGGVWLAILVLFFSVTGSALAKPDWFGIATLPEDAPASLAAMFTRVCPGNVSPGAAQRAAEAAHPGRRLAVFGFPHERREPYRLSLKAQGDLDSIGGDMVVFVHTTCPGIIAKLTPEGPATSIGQAMFSLHAGHSFGIIGKVLAFLAGIAAAALAITGTYVWTVRQLSKRKS